MRLKLFYINLLLSKDKRFLDKFRKNIEASNKFCLLGDYTNSVINHGLTD